MTAAVRRFVQHRAAGRCEYCLLPQSGHEERFSIDHIVAQQHINDETDDNLALCCLRCNLHKGTNLSSLDPVDRSIVPLFHPRQQLWRDHFQFIGSRIVALTSTGRATVAILQMNATQRVALRAALIAERIILPDA